MASALHLPSPSVKLSMNQPWTSVQMHHLPVRLIPTEPWTDEELFTFCRENRDLRVERTAHGEILLMSPTGIGTSRRNVSITAQLATWAEATGTGVSFDSNAGFVLSDSSMLSPDGAWLSMSRWEALSEWERNRFGPLCPDFVIELRSPSDSLPELRRKMKVWLSNGAQLAWLLDLQGRSVEIYRPGCEPEMLEQPDEVCGEGPVAGFTLKMRSIWS